MGQGHQDAGAVTGVGFESTAATVAHAGINMMGIQHDLVTGLPLNVGDKTDTTGILFHGWIVQPGFLRVAKFQG